MVVVFLVFLVVVVDVVGVVGVVGREGEGRWVFGREEGERRAVRGSVDATPSRLQCRVQPWPKHVPPRWATHPLNRDAWWWWVVVVGREGRGGREGGTGGRRGGEKGERRKRRRGGRGGRGGADGVLDVRVCPCMPVDAPNSGLPDTSGQVPGVCTRPLP